MCCTKLPSHFQKAFTHHILYGPGTRLQYFFLNTGCRSRASKNRSCDHPLPPPFPFALHRVCTRVHVCEHVLAYARARVPVCVCARAHVCWKESQPGFQLSACSPSLCVCVCMRARVRAYMCVLSLFSTVLPAQNGQIHSD